MYNMHMCIIYIYMNVTPVHILHAHHIKHISLLLTNSCKCNLRENDSTQTQRGTVD